MCCGEWDGEDVSPLMSVELKVRLNKELYKQSRMNFYERAVVTYS